MLKLNLGYLQKHLIRKVERSHIDYARSNLEKEDQIKDKVSRGKETIRTTVDINEIENKKCQRKSMNPKVDYLNK